MRLWDFLWYFEQRGDMKRATGVRQKERKRERYWKREGRGAKERKRERARERQWETDREREGQRERGHRRERQKEREKDREREQKRENLLIPFLRTSKYIFFHIHGGGHGSSMLFAITHCHLLKKCPTVDSLRWKETQIYTAFAITHCYFLEKSYRSFVEGERSCWKLNRNYFLVSS